MFEKITNIIRTRRERMKETKQVLLRAREESGRVGLGIVFSLFMVLVWAISIPAQFFWIFYTIFHDEERRLYPNG
jgi:hypothetical protein